MHTADSDRVPGANTSPHAVAGPARRIRPAASHRTRLAGILLLLACVLAAVGAVLPWLTAVNVSIFSCGTTTRLFTWHVWSTPWGLLFPLFAIPLFRLLRAGLRAVRGLPFSLGRRSAVLLSLAGCAGTVIFLVLLAIAEFDATFYPLLGRCYRTDVVIESGFYVSLASYLLASLAGLLLPPRTSN